MTGEKRTETRMRCYNTLCIPYISLHPSLHACIVYDCREGRGVIYREYTECYSISFLFLFFFHQSSLYPIKIFAKCFYLLVGMGVVSEGMEEGPQNKGKTKYVGIYRKVCTNLTSNNNLLLQRFRSIIIIIFFLV